MEIKAIVKKINLSYYIVLATNIVMIVLNCIDFGSNTKDYTNIVISITYNVYLLELLILVVFLTKA